MFPFTDKTQEIRLLDIFLLGPFMIWFGYQTKDLPDFHRAMMMASGVATIAYNYMNYRREQEIINLEARRSLLPSR